MAASDTPTDRGRCDMRRLLAAIAIAASFTGLADAQAQTYPSRPITIVVPFPAGGPTDALARILANRMKEALGQSVVVENPTGAAGTIGTGRVARAVPDGYTLILGHWQTTSSTARLTLFRSMWCRTLSPYRWWQTVRCGSLQELTCRRGT